MKLVLLIKIFLISLFLTGCKLGFSVTSQEKELEASKYFIETNDFYELTGNKLEIPLINENVKKQNPNSTHTCHFTKDEDGVERSCDSLTNILSINNGVFNINTTYTHNGSYVFLFKASYGNYKDEKSFKIEIRNINRAPVLSTVAAKSIDENVTLSFSLTATDEDGEEIVYSHDCSGVCPVGMSLVSGNFIWTPTYAQSGTYSVTFTITDNGSPSLSDTETISIVVNDVNLPPVLTSIPNQTVNEAVAIGLINANDAGDDFDNDVNPITYSCNYEKKVDGDTQATGVCTELTNLSFTNSTGVMSWTPEYGSGGEYIFEIVGSDGSLNASTLFTIIVNRSYPLTLTYRTIVSNESIALPTKSTSSYDYKIDWGDGSPLGHFTTSVSQEHPYAIAGDYTVKIYGKFPAINFYSLTTEKKLQLIGVNDLGRTDLVNLSGAFRDCTSLLTFNVGYGETINVTDMSSMFSKALKLTNLDLSNLNTSKVTNMYAMFKDTSGLISLNLSGFDTSNVTDMSSMFSGASKLASLDISDFNTTKVTNMSGMFNNLSILTDLDVSGFNTANVTNMSSMFSNLKGLIILDLSSFNTAKVTSMKGMFSNSNSIISLSLLNFNTEKVTDMSEMFHMASGLTDINVSSFNTSNVTNMSTMFNSLPKLTSLDVSHFDTSKVTNMSSMFNGASKLTSLDFSGFVTTNVTNMSGMFSGNKELLNIDVSGFNTSKVTNMSSMFYDNVKLIGLDLSSFNTSNVTEMINMFYNIPDISLDLSNFNTSNVTNMTQMFMYAKVRSLDLSSFDTAKVTNMYRMFYSPPLLTNLDISSFNTANVTNMAEMFNRVKLTSLDLSNFNTANVTNMSQMFYEASQLTDLDLSNFNTVKVTNMSSLFQNTSNLSSLDLTGWTLGNPVPNVTNIFLNSKSQKVIYCDQNLIGNTFGITCSNH